MLATLEAPRLELDRRLVARALERFARAALRLWYDVAIAEPLERIHVEARAKLLDLQPADAGDEGEMIVAAPARVALDPPVAHVAMLRGLWIRHRVACGERRFEP